MKNVAKIKKKEKGWRIDEKIMGDQWLYTSSMAKKLGPTPYQTRRAVRVVTGPLHRMWQLTGIQIAESILSY